MADPGAVTRKYLPEDRFLFFLGNTDPKKNTPRTLRGYAVTTNCHSARCRCWSPT